MMHHRRLAARKGVSSAGYSLGRQIEVALEDWERESMLRYRNALADVGNQIVTDNPMMTAEQMNYVEGICSRVESLDQRLLELLPAPKPKEGDATDLRRRTRGTQRH